VVLVDSNVFFDAADNDSPQQAWALEFLDQYRGQMGINQVVFTELLNTSSPQAIEAGLNAFAVARLDMPWDACLIAARAFSKYLNRRARQGERKRSAPLPDFFIGAHAEATGFPVATSDRGRFESYFPNVALI
jgi:predicted nucleic acid-binding protein